MINVLTLKVGNKYSSEYVNNLYNSLLANTTEEFNFFCYTEDGSNLNPNIKVVNLEDPNQFKLQWHKIKFHKSGFADIKKGERCLILDIDWIITNNLDPIMKHKLEDNQFGCFERWWSNRRDLCLINGGFQMYNMGDTNHLWEKFSSNPEHWQEYYINNGLADGPVNGEQNFIDENAGDNRYWFPMSWFAKYSSEDVVKIQRNWNRDVDPLEPYYLGGEFHEDIKMVHFSNADNLIHKSGEDWINEYWN